MASNTSRLGLIKPTTLEPRAVGPLNTNADRIDEIAGAFLINDGATIPDAQAFDGMIVKEKTSGKVWVLQKNVGGTFDKKYIRYPWSFTGYTTGFNIGNAAWGEYGIQNFGGSTIGAGGGPVNSSSADLVNTELVIPVTGIYSIKGQVKWNPNSTGVRAACFNINHIAAAEDVNTADICNAAVPFAGSSNSISLLEQIPAGTTIGFNLYQNSGGILAATFVIFAVLLEVTS